MSARSAAAAAVVAAVVLVTIQPPARAQTPPAAPAAPAADPMRERMLACTPCHGREGRAARDGYYPRIAGKPAGYLHEQLLNFQAGRRRNEAMQHLLQNLSDDYLHEIAGWFAALDLPYPPARPHGLSDAQAERALRLVRDGDPAREIPACRDCHGDALAGREPAMPGLLALPADYLLAQFGAWRTGQRRAREPDCMAQVARRLSADEIAVLARWLSAQSLPPGTKPAAAASVPLPLRCGSVR